MPSCARCRRHFVNYVRIRRAVSAACASGANRTACLPVTSLDRWSPRVIPAMRGDTRDPGSAGRCAMRFAGRSRTCRRLGRRPIWISDLIAVLQTQAVSTDHVRCDPCSDSELVENFSALDRNRSESAMVGRRKRRSRLQRCTIPGLPDDDAARHVRGVLSAHAAVHGSTGAASPTYPALLAAAGSSATAERTTFQAITPRPLLDRLAAPRTPCWNIRWPRAGSNPQATPLMTDELEPELVDIRTQPTVTIWRRLTARLVGLDPPVEIGAYLDNPENERDPAVTDLGGDTSGTSEPAPPWTPTCSISCCAKPWTLPLTDWTPGLRRSPRAAGSADRRAHPNEVVIGGYSWVEDLKPGIGSSIGRLPAGTVARPRGDCGDPGERLPITSSELALVVCDRSLVEARAARHDSCSKASRRGGIAGGAARLSHRTAAARVRARRRSSNRSGTLAPLDADGGARNVCHGVTLLELWRNRDADPRFRQVVPADATAAQAIDRVFAEIDDVVDALSDILLTESVFQVGRGRRSNIVTSFDGIVRGESFGEAEVLKTPRSGPAFLYRIVAFMPDSASGSPWTIGRERARALAEPRLNAWLGNDLRRSSTHQMASEG